MNKTTPTDAFPNEPAPLVSESAVARRLGLSLTHVKTWRTNFKGPPQIRIGHVVVYSETDLSEFVAASRRTKPE